MTRRRLYGVTCSDVARSPLSRFRRPLRRDRHTVVRVGRVPRVRAGQEVFSTNLELSGQTA